MTSDDIKNELFGLRDIKYRDFQSGLIPTVDKENIIGVRTPDLRRLAKKLANLEDVALFLNDLPHKYFDENQLHAFLISEIKEFDKCIEAVNVFLPFIDNWATCDQLSPAVFKKHRPELLIWIKNRIKKTKHTFTVRFAVCMLMKHFLDEAFAPEYPRLVAEIRSDDYYVNMAVAWYFATALAKQYEAVVSYIEERRLEAWTHNKAIQKAVESYRLTDQQKDYLKTFKVKKTV